METHNLARTKPARVRLGNGQEALESVVAAAPKVYHQQIKKPTDYVNGKVVTVI